MGAPIWEAAKAASGKKVTPDRSANSIFRTAGAARRSPIRPRARSAFFAVNGSTLSPIATATSGSTAAGSPIRPSASIAATCTYPSGEDTSFVSAGTASRARSAPSASAM